MRLLQAILLVSLLMGTAQAAPPVRDNTYIEGTDIEPDDVMANEDVILEYLQDGVDTYAPNSITTEAIATGAVTSDDIKDGSITATDMAVSLGNALPTGAIFFMLSGNCPSWTTDISSTYSNMFLRINATPGSTGGTNTHTHAVGTLTGTAHTHSIAAAGGSASAWNATRNAASSDAQDAAQLQHTHGAATGSGGSGAISGTTASGDNVPQHVLLRACQVN